MKPWALRQWDVEGRIAFAAVALTPVALLLDYRADISIWTKTVVFTPLVGLAGRTSKYEEVFGLTQILWLLAAAAVLTRPAARRGLRSAPTAPLLLLLVLILGMTAVHDGIDGFTAHALLTTLVPIAAMSVVICGPGIEASAVRASALVLVAATALVTVATVVKGAADGTLHKRLDLALFGPPTDAGAVLAALILLVLIVPAGWVVRGLLGLTLMGGLLLTETRGALMGVIAGGAAIALAERRFRLPVLAAATAAVAAFAAFGDRSFSFGDDSNLIRRENLAHHLLLFRDHPGVGYGLSEPSAAAFRAAHNTLLGLANVAGIVAPILWLYAWLAPLVAAARRRLDAARLPLAVAAGVFTAYFVAWNTTGGELLVYAPPTNMLPLLLVVALAVRESRANPDHG